MAADNRVQVMLRRSTVEMIQGFDPNAPTLDDAIEEMIIAKPPPSLLKELNRREKGRFVTREGSRRRHGH
ncbi:MAG: hypothetical protein WB809_08250 [Thermoplasmata archaeon]